MPRTLRRQFLLLITLVVLTTLGLVGIYFNRVFRLQLRRIAIVDPATHARYSERLAAHYARTSSWVGVQPVIDNIASEADSQAILTTPDGKPVAFSPRSLANEAIQIGESSVTIETGAPDQSVQRRRAAGLFPIPILDRNRATIAKLYLLPSNPVSWIWQAPLSLGLNKTLFWGVVFVGMLGVWIAAMLSRRILRPVEQLTAVVRRMEQGDLSSRAPVTGSDEIGELARAFNSMAETLSRNDRQRRDLMNDIAHELRSPLTSMRCQLESIQDHLLEASPETLGNLQREALLLTSLIGDLERLALAETGQLPLERTALSIPEEIARLSDSAAARAKNIDVRVEIAPDLPPAYADAQCVHQALRNILDNAIFHVPAGGLIELSAASKNGKIEIVISDNGPGIAPEHLAHIWERFYRTDPSRTRSTGGSGLGLAIVKQLVEINGGESGVESQLGAGARFWIRLPTAKTG